MSAERLQVPGRSIQGSTHKARTASVGGEDNSSIRVVAICSLYVLHVARGNMCSLGNSDVHPIFEIVYTASSASFVQDLWTTYGAV
jgi:hypothetical protein